MDFGYTQEQEQLRKTIRAFADREIRPHVMEWDESQHFPIDVFRKLGELGAMGVVRVATMPPVSRPASIRMSVTPVSASPSRMAHWIGAAPRQRGRSEVWTLRQPCRGISSRLLGRICP